ncbi:hypothetical protein [Sphingomonas sp. PP-CE-3G-477]|uniref:hypothetical protein n=1 Tax=Sphingomonas sp. PP-CE-3G-477 TaxID=2135660 RepID=UPI0011B27F61|nr:hypothetical protein [Sphingomonas sp. PP-CE-3G-477]
MAKRFVLATQTLPESIEVGFITELRKKKFGWWHRLPGVWLVIDRTDTLTAQDLRDLLKKLSPSTLCLSMEIPKGNANWSGLKIDDDMFSWLKSDWNENQPAVPAQPSKEGEDLPVA